jgi:hypothetical protein
MFSLSVTRHRYRQSASLTIALEKAGARIVAAAEDVAGSCRRAAATLAGSRADYPSRHAVALVSDLAKSCAPLSRSCRGASAACYPGELGDGRCGPKGLGQARVLDANAPYMV